jgi:hypothetical protein
MHVPVTDRCERFDAKEKRAGETGRIQVGDAPWDQVVQETK